MIPLFETQAVGEDLYDLALRRYLLRRAVLGADGESLGNICFSRNERGGIAISLGEQVEEVGGFIAIFQRRKGPDQVLGCGSDWNRQVHALAMVFRESLGREEQKGKSEKSIHHEDN